MKKLIWFTTTSILLLLFVIPAFLAASINMTPANDQPGYDSNVRLSIYGERQITQTFISRQKNLMAIATSIKNPNLKNKKDITLNLYDESENLIRSSVLNGFNIGDGDFMKFIFGEIKDSKDVKYSFTLSSPASGPGEILEVFIIEPNEDILEYSYEDEDHFGGIPMVTFHKPESSLETVKLVYSNWISKLLP